MTRLFCYHTKHQDIHQKAPFDFSTFGLACEQCMMGHIASKSLDAAAEYRGRFHTNYFYCMTTAVSERILGSTDKDKHPHQMVFDTVDELARFGPRLAAATQTHHETRHVGQQTNSTNSCVWGVKI